MAKLLSFLFNIRTQIKSRANAHKRAIPDETISAGDSAGLVLQIIESGEL